MRIEASRAELLAQPLACLRIRAAVKRERLDACRPLVATQFEREIGNSQAQVHAIFQPMGRKAVDGVVPTEIRVAVVWLRRNIGARRSREPLHGMMGLQARDAQPALVNASKSPPIRSTLGRRTPVRLAFPLSCPNEIGDDLAQAEFC